MKGNINPNGEKRYYKPGDPNYNQVNPEQLFMSEEEAKVAGFIRIFRP
ncbi:sunset domain-containing protein [Kurthia gibsonii]